MIIIKLWGGLGNQMFQYAFGYQLAKKTNSEIVLDVSWFTQQNMREPEILKFRIEYSEIKRVWEDNGTIAFLNRPYPNRLIRIPGFARYRISGMDYLKESRYSYSEKIAEYGGDSVYLDGYWQCPKYFEAEENDLRHMYIPKQISDEVFEIGEKMRHENSVALHVRRGDYPKKRLWYSRLLALDDEYYKQAVREMEERRPGCQYYLFSNEIDSAKNMIQQIIERDVEVIRGLSLTALDEWYLMGCCQNQIIGNSTFSWWAAYVNGKQDKVVCAPNKYFGNENIIPSNWVQIHII